MANNKQEATYGLSLGKLQYTNTIATREATKIRPSRMKGPVLLSTFCDVFFDSEERDKSYVNDTYIT